MNTASIRIGAASLVAAALVLTSCSGAPEQHEPTRDPDEPVTITFLHRWPEEEYAPWFQKMAEAYEEANPNVTIEIEAVGNADYRERLQLLTGQSKTPDLFWATPGNLTNEFVRAGLAHDVTKGIEEDGGKDSLDQQAREG